MEKVKTKIEQEVNIPRTVKDPNYRYTMPVMSLTITGKHQAQNTRINNLISIADSLERPPLYLMKFFNAEFNTRIVCDDEKRIYSVHGARSQYDMEKVLDKFIGMFVLCKCGNPETTAYGSKGKLKLRCRACGEQDNPVDMMHKLSSFILKNLPEKEAQDTQIKTGGDMLTKTQLAQWSLDTSKDAVESRRRQAMGAAAATELDNTQEAVSGAIQLVNFVNQEPMPGLDQFTAKVEQLQKKESWSDRTTIQNVFVALFDENILKQILTRAPLLESFVSNEKDSAVVLSCLEKLCSAKPSVIDHINEILQCFYEEQIIEEGIVRKWHKHPLKSIDRKIAAQIRKQAQPFVDWLNKPSSDDDDE